MYVFAMFITTELPLVGWTCITRYPSGEFALYEPQ